MERGTLEGRIDKKMAAWNSNSVYSLAALSPTESTSRTTTSISCSTSITPPSMSNSVHAHPCTGMITLVTSSTTNSFDRYSSFAKVLSSQRTSTSCEEQKWCVQQVKARKKPFGSIVISTISSSSKLRACHISFITTTYSTGGFSRTSGSYYISFNSCVCFIIQTSATPSLSNTTESRSTSPCTMIMATSATLACSHMNHQQQERQAGNHSSRRCDDHKGSG